MAGTLEEDVDVWAQVAVLIAQMQEQSDRLQTLENENAVYCEANDKVRMENSQLSSRVNSLSALAEAPCSSSRGFQVPVQLLLSFDTPRRH